MTPRTPRTQLTHAPRRPARRRLPAVVALAVSALVLTACGDSGEPAQPPENTSASTFNDSDVMFAQMMIPHHEQAVRMSELAPGRAADEEIKSLAAKIEKAQAPEITTMKAWLKSWDRPTSSHGMDHDHGAGMPGMMSDEDMADLKKAKAEKFDRMFAEMMIEHHEGAIAMAEDEQKSGRNAEARKLAGKVVKAQTAEVGEMKKILDRI